MANSNEDEERIPFSSPIFNRGIEIVKSYEPEINNNFDYYYDEEEDKSKNILIPIISVILLGIVGYFGFNYLQKDNKKDVNQPHIIKEEIQNTNKIEEKEEIYNRVTATPIVKESEPDTKLKEIIESIIKKQEPEVVIPTPVEKVEKKEPEPKKIISPTIENKTTSENIEDMQKKVIQTLVQNAKPKKHKKIVKVQKPKKPQYKVVTVKKGDTLASISKRFYGNPMLFKRIIRANKDIKSASSHLHIGQKIIVPILKSKKIDNKKIIRKRVVKKKRVAKKKARRRIITVRRGDTLSTIAKRFYGNPAKYYKIVNANYKIKSKHTHLYIGQRIYVPR
ncbi:MAG: LysM peptidoglycan-binding domain-containing protein [Sulfurovaceae bacterium]|nr:LysM peptidoglycan-binding domain-containing protein [Sulfurovaceae bacterium]